jgi:hypothetical protein
MEGDEDPVLERMIGHAHDIFDFSIFEVIDIDDRASAILVLVEHFGPQPMELIERYFEILERIREHISK